MSATSTNANGTSTATATTTATTISAAIPKWDKNADMSFIDLETFNQILEMDDEGDNSFSKGIVVGFVDQAQQTLVEMEKLLKEKDLDQLSSRGHFLKGSSATLGLVKIRDACEKIQHYGAMKDEDGMKDLPSQDEALNRISKIVDQLKEEYKTIRSYFIYRYGDLEEP